MQLGRKLAEGYAVDLEADEAQQPVPSVTTGIVAQERPEPEPVELPVRV